MRNFSSVAGATSLSADISNSATSIAVGSTSGFPSADFTLVLDPGLASEEIVTVTNVAGLTLTVTRGADGTTAVAHTAGAVVRHMATGRDLQDSQNHIAATTAVHGLTGAVVGTSDAQTLTNKSISGATNTLSAIAQASVTGLTTIQSDVTALNSHPTATTGIHGVGAGSVVGTTLTQTLTNKTMSGASNTFSNIAQSVITNLATDLSTINGTLSSHTSTLGTYGTNITDLQTADSNLFQNSSFTPSYTGFAPGSGAVNVGRVYSIGDFVFVWWRTQCGTSPSFSSTIQMALPSPYTGYAGGGTEIQSCMGFWNYRDDSETEHWSGACGMWSSSANSVSFSGAPMPTSYKPATRLGTSSSISPGTSDVLSGVLVFVTA